MISLKLESPGGGVKEKVVLFGSMEDSSGLASCPSMIDSSISCSIVLHVLVPSETILSLWVELAPVFRYRSMDFTNRTFLLPKQSKEPWLKGLILI
jgi:hypothetical protein